MLSFSDEAGPKTWSEFTSGETASGSFHLEYVLVFGGSLSQKTSKEMWLQNLGFIDFCVLVAYP